MRCGRWTCYCSCQFVYTTSLSISKYLLMIDTGSKGNLIPSRDSLNQVYVLDESMSSPPILCEMLISESPRKVGNQRIKV
jgi:hypothetical protein